MFFQCVILPGLKRHLCIVPLRTEDKYKKINKNKLFCTELNEYLFQILEIHYLEAEEIFSHAATLKVYSIIPKHH